MKILKEKKGITLIALVITIIVLLILAAVTLNLILGDNGIITKADEAKTASNQKEVEEQLKLKVQEYLANNDGEFNRSGFLSSLTEFTNNGDNTVTKDGVTLSIGTKGEVAIVNNSDNSSSLLTWDVSEAQDNSVIMTYDSSTKTVTVSGNGSIMEQMPAYYLSGLDTSRMSDEEYMAEFMDTHLGEYGKIINFDYPAETLIIENGVTSIGRCAFVFCSTIKNIIMSNSITSIGEQAFAASGITNITIIPDNITSISSGLFQECENLTDVTIPDSITSIGSQAFNYCSRLKTVRIPDSVTSIGGSAFRDIAENSTIYCESQDVANLLRSDIYDDSKTTVIVDASKF